MKAFVSFVLLIHTIFLVSFTYIVSDTEGIREENNNEKEDEDESREIIVSDCSSNSHSVPRVEPRVPAGFISNNPDRDSVSVIVDDDDDDEDEEDNSSRSREHCSPLCNRRSPAPLPSTIRATCRPTSRSPPCEKVLPRQTEKPKIWSLAHTATSSSPERERRSRSPVRSPIHNGVAAMPASLAQNFRTPYDSPMSSLRQWVDGQFHGGLPIPRMSTGLPMHQLSAVTSNHQGAPTCVVSSSQGPLFSTAPGHGGNRYPLLSHDVTALHNGVSITASPQKEGKNYT